MCEKPARNPAPTAKAGSAWAAVSLEVAPGDGVFVQQRLPACRTVTKPSSAQGQGSDVNMEKDVNAKRDGISASSTESLEKLCFSCQGGEPLGKEALFTLAFFNTRGVGGFLLLRVPATLLSLAGSPCPHRPFVQLFPDVCASTQARTDTKMLILMPKAAHAHREGTGKLLSILARAKAGLFRTVPAGRVLNTSVSVTVSNCATYTDLAFAARGGKRAPEELLGKRYAVTLDLEQSKSEDSR
ncbi:hypothetical protein CB1_002145003 [Camelus ferus]|nr:hypothetical protein CB1_002145003 [Camelus ferus]